MTLPDVSMVHGRMFVTAWDCGLDSVEEDAVKLLMIAIEVSNLHNQFRFSNDEE